MLTLFVNVFVCAPACISVCWGPKVISHDALHLQASLWCHRHSERQGEIGRRGFPSWPYPEYNRDTHEHTNPYTLFGVLQEKLLHVCMQNLCVCKWVFAPHPLWTLLCCPCSEGKSCRSEALVCARGSRTKSEVQVGAETGQKAEVEGFEVNLSFYKSAPEPKILNQNHQKTLLSDWQGK